MGASIVNSKIKNKKNSLTKKWIKGTIINSSLTYNSTFVPVKVEMLLDINGKEISVYDKNLLYGSSEKKINERLEKGTALELLVGRRFELSNKRCFNSTPYKHIFGNLGFNMGSHRYYYSHKIYEANF